MTEPLRILVAHNVPRARNGGMSRIMGFIHDRLADAGHEVDYFCAEDVPAALNGRLTRFTFPLLLRRVVVAAAQARKPYDLVNVHEPVSAAVSTWKAAAGNPVVVVTSHGLERRAWELALEELRLGRQGPGLKSRLVYPLTSLWQSTFGLRRADHLFCLNAEDRDYLMRWLNRPAEDVTRIFPAAEPAYASAAEGRDYGRADQLLFAGTWRKNKGIEDLVPAFAALAARRPGLTLTVLGSGVPEAEVSAAFPAEVRPRVRCLRTSSEAENAAAYAAADVFLLPSLFEGTPLTLIEAMMSGLPIVTTATCGMKDVIRHGANGLLVPIRSPEAVVAALEQLLADAAGRARLGRAARVEALEQYTWDRVAEPVREVYERLCQGRGAGCRRRRRTPRDIPNGLHSARDTSPPREDRPPAPERRLRILLTSFVENNQWTGMGKWACRMAKGLAQRGHVPAVWFADDFPTVRRLGRLAVLLFPAALAARLWRVRSEFDAFVVHEPGGLWYGLLRRLFPSLPPMVVMCHNVESKYFGKLLQAAAVGLATVPPGMRLKTRLFRLWQSDGAIRLADHVLCLSTIDRDYLVDRLGCRPDRVTRLVNGVAAENFWHRPERSRGRRVLFVGGWLDVKGRRLLPPLWSQVHARFPDARLTVVGTGRPLETVLADFRPADRESVSVIPLLTSEAEMRVLFAAHDLFLMPSLSEGSPLALLEAMATMLPAVAAGVGGIPDMITHGVDGLLFRPLDPADGADQVGRLLADPDEAARLGRAGQERVRALTWEAASHALARTVETTVDRARGRWGRSGAARHIRTTGAEMKALLVVPDLFLAPSEGAPLALWEAVAAMLPVLAAGVGA